MFSHFFKVGESIDDPNLLGVNMPKLRILILIDAFQTRLGSPQRNAFAS